MLGKEAGPRCPVFSNSPVKRSNRAEKQLPQGFYRISLDFLSSIAFRTKLPYSFGKRFLTDLCDDKRKRECFCLYMFLLEKYIKICNMFTHTSRLWQRFAPMRYAHPYF